MRDLARKQNMTIEEYRQLCEREPKHDKDLDDYQRELGEKQDNFVIEGRTSFHFIPHSIKIYLDVDPMEAARRRLHDETAGDERNEKTFTNLEETAQNLKERKENENISFKKHYGIKPHNKDNFDLVVDTTNITPDQVVERILNYLKEKGHI